MAKGERPSGNGQPNDAKQIDSIYDGGRTFTSKSGLEYKSTGVQKIINRSSVFGIVGGSFNTIETTDKRGNHIQIQIEPNPFLGKEYYSYVNGRPVSEKGTMVRDRFMMAHTFSNLREAVNAAENAAKRVRRK